MAQAPNDPTDEQIERVHCTQEEIVREIDRLCGELGNGSTVEGVAGTTRQSILQNINTTPDSETHRNVIEIMLHSVMQSIEIRRHGSVSGVKYIYRMIYVD